MAETVYMGGHIHNVNLAEAAALTAAGFYVSGYVTDGLPATWDDLIAMYPTWDDLADALPSWESLLP